MEAIAFIISFVALAVSLSTLVWLLRVERKLKRMKQVTDWHQPLH